MSLEKEKEEKPCPAGYIMVNGVCVQDVVPPPGLTAGEDAEASQDED